MRDDDALVGVANLRKVPFGNVGNVQWSIELGLNLIGGPAREYQTLKQRIAGESIGAV